MLLSRCLNTRSLRRVLVRTIWRFIVRTRRCCCCCLSLGYHSFAKLVCVKTLLAELDSSLKPDFWELISSTCIQSTTRTHTYRHTQAPIDIERRERIKHDSWNLIWFTWVDSTMGWLRLVGSLKFQISFAKEPCKRDDILQKKPMILRSLLIVATPYTHTFIQTNTRINRYTQCVLKCVCVCARARVCVCVCDVCAYVCILAFTHAHTHTHTRTHTHTHTNINKRKYRI